MFAFAEFFASLTKGVKAALPYFTSAAATDKGVNEIVRTARELGFSFREQQARDVIGVLRNNLENDQTLGRSIRVQGNNAPLNPSLYGVTIGRTLKNFSYTVERTLRGKESGQFDISHVTVISNEPLSVNQILDTAEQMTTGNCNPLFEPVSIESHRVISARRSPSYEI